MGPRGDHPARLPDADAGRSAPRGCGCEAPPRQPLRMRMPGAEASAPRRRHDVYCRKPEFVQVAENASKRHFSGDFRKWSQNGYLERCLRAARLRSTDEQHQNLAAWWVAGTRKWRFEPKTAVPEPSLPSPTNYARTRVQYRGYVASRNASPIHCWSPASAARSAKREPEENFTRFGRVVIDFEHWRAASAALCAKRESEEILRF